MEVLMDIILETQNGDMVDLSAYKGRKVLFFYPRANTPG
jgi:peroxiredoxin